MGISKQCTILMDIRSNVHLYGILYKKKEELTMPGKMPTNPSRGGKYSGSAGRNTSRNPPPRTGAPGAHRAGGGCGKKKTIVPLIMLFPFLLIKGMINEYKGKNISRKGSN